MLFGRRPTWAAIALGLAAFTLGLVRLAAATFNLYLRPNEVRRLLGLSAELSYVREGKVNDYALGFVVLVPAHISELYFTWQSLRPPPMPYSIGITVSNPEALGTPQLNISHRGTIPTQEEVFRVFLPCTGKLNAEVELQLQLNITMTSSMNMTRLNLRRKKICLKDDSHNGTVMMGPTSIATVTNSFYIGVGCATALIVIIAIVALISYFRSQKPHRNETMSYGKSSPGLSTQGQTFLRVDTPNNASATGSYSSFRRLTPVSANPPIQVNDFRASELTEQISEISIEKSKLGLKEKLQEGTFGQIYHGILIDDDSESSNEQHVFIKTVSDQASEVQISLLLTEGMMMYGMNHKNILPVIGVCTHNLQRPLLVYPYMNQGNLKKFLQKCKFSAEGHCHTLLSQDLVAMAIQIIHGMIYLHKKKVIHRDLATRNCVVDDWLHVKITDNALSRDLFPNDYHCLGDNENRPVKWLAIESLLKKEFSPSSDVWSFGVAVWELMTLGQQPYVEIDPFEMDAYLRDGYRLSQPINCPDELFAVMACCWASIPEERPTFTQLLACLQDFYAALGRYI